MRSTEGNEIWLPVVGYEGDYAVSNQGRVYSLKTCKILKLGTLPAGYKQVTLSRPGGKQRRRYVHRLMAQAFLPNPENLPLVRHLNDVKDDNRVENLAWGTSKDNTADMLRLGNHPNQKKTHCKRGHEFSPENTRIDSTGKRTCRTCRREADAEPLTPDDERHGTMNGYFTRGCRCPKCFEVGRRYRASLNPERLEPGDPRHGTLTGYAYHKCRCDLCRDNRRNWERERARKKREQNGGA